MRDPLWEALNLSLPAVLDYLQAGQFPEVHSGPSFPVAGSQQLADHLPHFQETADEDYYYKKNKGSLHPGDEVRVSVVMAAGDVCAAVC